MRQIEKIEPWIKRLDFQLTAPSLGDNTADVDRLRKGIQKELRTEQIKIDISLVKKIPDVLRESSYKVNAVLYEYMGVWHLVDIFQAGFRDVYGVAVDLGTSTVVVRLLNLSNGDKIEEISFHNPQIEMGTDILTRIHFSSKESGLKKLQKSIMKKINEEIGYMAERKGVDLLSIVGISVAGNTTMIHFFLGLNPYWICREPYIPVVNRIDVLEASSLNLLVNPRAPVMILPNVGSYFGGDLIAGILASGMTQNTETAFLVDVGTNAEVVIGNKDWLMACAGAAGPALEGGVADMGMMAGPGVIDEVSYDSSTGSFVVRTIGNLKPIGICGSGLIDLVAELFMAGMIDLRGKFVAEKCGAKLIDMDGIRHLVIVRPDQSGTGEPLTLTQTDIDGLMRSKAAMYTILTTISNYVGMSLNGIGRFYIAGTFGSYINPRSAINIGMIPDLPIERYVPLGNTSLEGATLVLLDLNARNEAIHIRARITYVELNVNQEFMNLFSAAKFIPHTDRTLFPSVRVNDAG